MNAVITADIIAYSRLSIDEQDSVLSAIYDTLEGRMNARTNVDSSFLISRGDSIQIELDKASDALRAALLLKTGINQIAIHKGNKNKPVIDVRIAIGIGGISKKRAYVNESTGDAYTFSGRTLDLMKKSKRTLAIKTFSEVFNAELETEFLLLEVIMSGWTIYSAEVIYWKLLGLNEKEISIQLKKSQSAINQRNKAAGWHGIESLLERFESLLGNASIT